MLKRIDALRKSEEQSEAVGKYVDTGMEPEELRKAGKWIPVEKGGIE